MSDHTKTDARRDAPVLDPIEVQQAIERAHRLRAEKFREVFGGLLRTRSIDRAAARTAGGGRATRAATA